MIEIVDFQDFSFDGRTIRLQTKNHGEFCFTEVHKRSVDDMILSGSWEGCNDMRFACFWRDGNLFERTINENPLKNYLMNDTFIEKTILKTLMSSKDERVICLLKLFPEIRRIAARKRIRNYEKNNTRN
jgi:hypothetical protein